MVMPNEDVVQIQGGQKPGDPFVVTINCPDKTGLGCDLCRIILEFGLSITRADVSTDGRWCYVIFWVLPPPTITPMRWSNLKSRLLSVCPSCSISFFFDPPARSAPSLYLLKFLCLNRKGLLHDVTQVLSELELIIQRVKVSTTPDGRVMDLFFVTDNMLDSSLFAIQEQLKYVKECVPCSRIGSKMFLPIKFLTRQRRFVLYSLNPYVSKARL